MGMRLSWIWALLATAGGLALMVTLDLIENPDSTAGDIVLNLLEEMPLMLLIVGVVLLINIVQRYRDERQLMSQNLEAARAQGERWRHEAAAHVNGLSVAIAAQFAQWGLTAAERDVALLLLKGFSTKEIATLRARSERTVREQARSTYQKSELTGRAALSAYFLEDLLTPSSSAKSLESGNGTLC